MIGILYGVKKNLLIKFMKKGYKGINELIILGIITNYVGRIILLGILKNIKRIWKDKGKIVKHKLTISIRLPMSYPHSMLFLQMNSNDFNLKMRKRMCGS